MNFGVVTLIFCGVLLRFTVALTNVPYTLIHNLAFEIMDRTEMILMIYK